MNDRARIQSAQLGNAGLYEHLIKLRKKWISRVAHCSPSANPRRSVYPKRVYCTEKTGMVSGTVGSAGATASYTSLLNFARVGAVFIGYLAGSSMNAQRERNARRKLEAELQRQAAELQALREQLSRSEDRAASTGDPVQDWIQSLSSS
jgi:hypothetical protein